MSIEIVNTLNDGTAHYVQVNPLDGVLFFLYFDFNTRDQHWYLSIHDSDDVPIDGCVGKKLVVNMPVYLRSTAENRPKGELLVVGSKDAGIRDLGIDPILYYVPEAEGAALRAAV